MSSRKPLSALEPVYDLFKSRPNRRPRVSGDPVWLQRKKENWVPAYARTPVFLLLFELRKKIVNRFLAVMRDALNDYEFRQELLWLHAYRFN
jgi:hypothetical protein